MLSIKKFNDNWLFTKEDQPSYAIERINEAEVIALPHCFNAIDGQDGDGMFTGACWYQKHLNITDEELNKHLFLEIGAASLLSNVYLNGTLVKSNNCGFSMFRTNLTGYLKEGNNLISIRVDNSLSDSVYPLMGDFSFYGGIYRDVKLIEAEPMHFDLLDNGRDGIYVTQRKIDENNFELDIKGKVVNEDLNPADGKIIIKLRDKEGNLVLDTTRDLDVSSETEFNILKKIKNPNLWQGVNNPYMYSLEFELFSENKICDKKTIEIGFRSVEIDPDKGVHLNGKAIKLNGVARHQDFAGVGNALTKEHMDLDMSLIKEVGANSVRLSHYQHDDYFYSLCDREGILVWAEIPFISVPSTSDKTNQNAKDQLERLIKQAYNHTSIYCWGIQNEITVTTENDYIYDQVKELASIAKNLDKNRYTAQANIYSVADESPLNEFTDLIGYNLYYGWYYKEIQDLGPRLDDFHKAKPNKPIMVTEYGVDTNPKFHSYDPKVKDYTEEFQLLFHDNSLKTFAERPFVLGGYVWNMFDFGSDTRNEGDNKGKNQKGLVTIDRKIKKDAFYLYKAYWAKEPFVKLAGSRFKNRHEALNDIVVLSNLNRIRLYLNDKFQTEINNDEPMKKFNGVKLSLGENTVKVEAFDKDGTIYSDEIVLNYVSKVDDSYIYVKPEQKRHVTNWFEKFVLSNEEVAIVEGNYSTSDTIETLYENEQAKEVFKKYFDKTAEDPRFSPMKGLFSIDSMSKLSTFNIPKELINTINKELNVIPKIRNVE
ncbi:glycoside hydrolase family 2 protein [Enterococcus casseliflavus]|uniref:glycoside hydrolase family 2 protein n=1 Tax=Enterococcus casseliflavus TaxID=37734 RepID=UPI00298BCF8A|nr:glycoside hydrolase family 2 TIM barrel-domain containing protein [Enterococcus casseliflavus]